MRDWLFSSWGAFWMVLFMIIPFVLMFVYVLTRKGSRPGEAAHGRLSRYEGVWMTVVFVVFVGVNLASLKFMPTIATAHAATVGEPVQEIDVSAQSWAYDISDRKIVAGFPVRFNGKSTDTQHGFAVYHPDGRMLFTMILMPGLTKPTQVVHTFTDPGTYKVRCLEYCGIAHHAMLDELTVVASN